MGRGFIWNISTGVLLLHRRPHRQHVSSHQPWAGKLSCTSGQGLTGGVPQQKQGDACFTGGSQHAGFSQWPRLGTSRISPVWLGKWRGRKANREQAPARLRKYPQSLPETYYPDQMGLSQGFPGPQSHAPSSCPLQPSRDLPAPATTAVIKLKWLGLIPMQHAYFLALQRRNRKSRNFLI